MTDGAFQGELNRIETRCVPRLYPEKMINQFFFRVGIHPHPTWGNRQS
jgi:hypothetical protein